MYTSYNSKFNIPLDTEMRCFICRQTKTGEFYQYSSEERVACESCKDEEELYDGRGDEDKKMIKFVSGGDFEFEKFLAAEANKALTSECCADNLRIAIVGNETQERLYEKALNRGCCGYKDYIVKYKNIEVKIGFNYGH